MVAGHGDHRDRLQHIERRVAARRGTTRCARLGCRRGSWMGRTLHRDSSSSSGPCHPPSARAFPHVDTRADRRGQATAAAPG
jgi:hypothetical protein